MVSQTAIAVAALLQILGKSFFVAQPMTECSPAPALGGSIFLLSMLLLIWDCDILPRLYKKYAPYIFIVAEVLATVFIIELLIQVGWCAYERLTYRLVNVVCYRKAWCEFGLMTVITVVGAFASLCIVVESVCPARIKDSMGDILSSLPVPEAAGPLVNYIQDVRSYIMGAIYFSQLTREQRLFAVQAFELQVRRSTSPQDKQGEEQFEDPASQDLLDLQADGNQEKQSEEQYEDPEEQTQLEEQHENSKEKTQILLDLQATEPETVRESKA